MRRYSAISLALTLQLGLLVGCTTFTGVKPISPKVGNPDSPPVVADLRPTFQWEPYPEAEAYDFVIYERIKTEQSGAGTRKPVYYRERLKATTHRIEEPLKPDTEYSWSVRIRRGTEVSGWSVYDYMVDIGVYGSQSKQMFVFKTPKAAQ